MQKHVVIIEDEYFKANYSIFKNPSCVWTKTIVEDELFKDDELHAKLLKAKKKAEKELRDYEYNIRNNFKR